MSSVANWITRVWTARQKDESGSPQDKNTGPRLLRSNEPTPSAAIPDPRCQFFFSDGRRCRAPRGEGHLALCLRHAHALSQAPEMIDVAPPSGEFRTATDVNRALGKVFLLLAQNRISRRNAVALGYLGQLLLQTLPAVREEINSCLGHQAWTETLESAFREEDSDAESDDEPEIAPQSEVDDQNGQDEAEHQEHREVPLGMPISALTAGSESPQTRMAPLPNREERSEATRAAAAGNSPRAVCAASAPPKPKSATRQSTAVAKPAQPAPMPAWAAKSKSAEAKTFIEPQLFPNEHLQNWGRGRGANLLIPNRNPRRLWTWDGRSLRGPR